MSGQGKRGGRGGHAAPAKRGGHAAPAKRAVHEFLKWRIPAWEPAGAIALHAGAYAPPADDPFREITTAVNAASNELFSGLTEREAYSLMRAVDLYASLKARVHEDHNMMVATNASLKMYEMLGQMGLLADRGRARVFCNAEFPGAFIVAINHYVKTMCVGTNLDWVGSSYVSADGSGNLLGDQYGLYAGNRDRWLMGPAPNALGDAGGAALSGDVTDGAVVTALAAAVRARFAATGGATLYTSDAGVDVSADYGRQEELTATINFGQVLCGLLSLAPGGSLVTKQYTFNTAFSRGLIALASAFFDETYLVKPLTSRPTNSEVYLVGKGFRGERLTADLTAALLGRLAAMRAAGGAPPPLVDPALFADVDDALLRVARQLYGRQQVPFLKEAAAYYAQYRGRLDELGRTLARDATRVQELWFINNPMRRIRDDMQLATSK